MKPFFLLISIVVVLMPLPRGWTAPQNPPVGYEPSEYSLPSLEKNRSFLPTLGEGSDISTTVTLTFSNAPAFIAYNQNFQVGINYSDFQQGGLRGRIFLEIRNAEDDALISRYHDDNDLKGHQGAEGKVFFTCSIPEGYSSVYFVAYISPLGFNPYIIDAFEAYPRDGSYPYDWHGNGVTRDIYYLDNLIISDNQVGNACYCCGITYEAFMNAWDAYNTAKGNDPANIWGMSVSGMRSFRRKLYAADGTISGGPGAITTYDCGVEIKDWDQVCRGDFMQIWRKSGSGHSVIIDGWNRNQAGEKISLRYWSSQGSTSGIGYNTENYDNFDTSKTTIARVVKPVDEDDWKNRFPVEATTPDIPVGNQKTGRCGYFLY